MTRSGVVVRLAVLALLVAAPALLDTYNTFLLTEILIFGLFAASLDLLIGYSGLPSLGHGGYYGVGAYAAGLLALHATTNAFAQIAVATGVAAAAALVTGVFAVRSRGVYFVMLTLAFGQLLWVLALNWTSLTGGSNGIFGIGTPTLARGSRLLASTDHFYWYVVCVFLVGYSILWLIVRSPFGRALAAIRENESRAASLGYNVQLYKLAVFTIAGARRGLCGLPRLPAAEVLLAGRHVLRGVGRRGRRDRDRRPAVADRRRPRRGLLLRPARPALGRALVALAARARRVLRPRRLPASVRLRRRRPVAQAEARAMTAVLELEAVGRRYGELRAVDGVTLAVDAGSRHALIGPNGAGKSTLFHLISGTCARRRDASASRAST